VSWSGPDAVGGSACACSTVSRVVSSLAARRASDSSGLVAGSTPPPPIAGRRRRARPKERRSRLCIEVAQVRGWVDKVSEIIESCQYKRCSRRRGTCPAFASPLSPLHRRELGRGKRPCRRDSPRGSLGCRQTPLAKEAGESISCVVSAATWRRPRRRAKGAQWLGGSAPNRRRLRTHPLERHRGQRPYEVDLASPWFDFKVATGQPPAPGPPPDTRCGGRAVPGSFRPTPPGPREGSSVSSESLRAPGLLLEQCR